ncbi:MAG TPA: leucine-rich repeat domain-containing protein, partial [Dinghuibacter sp.]
VADNVVSLKLSDLPVGDSALALIARCHGLVRLWLDHTHVRSVGALASLTKLRYLNLSSTAVSDVTPLAGLPSLRELFLYGSAVDKSRWAALKAQFPHTLLDSGGYTVSSLPTDTAIVRAPKR